MIAASSMAPDVDRIFYTLLISCGTLTFLVFSTIAYFLIKFRSSNKKVDRRNPQKHQLALEITWVLGSLIMFLPLFVWGAKTFFALYVPPANAIEINVTAKQWMWKFRSSNGASEINELHVPLGTPIKLVMISEDVIHSFFVPDFRAKQDVLPGRYTTLWFTPTKVGRFQLLCTQYCGTNHSGMNGFISVLTPTDFEKWQHTGGLVLSLKDKGEFLFKRFQCAACHDAGPAVAPSLNGIMGRQTELVDGTKIIADENYVIESILSPTAKIVKGFKPIMPSFKGQLTTQDGVALVAYIKSLSQEVGKPK